MLTLLPGLLLSTPVPQNWRIRRLGGHVMASWALGHVDVLSCVDVCRGEVSSSNNDSRRERQ